VVKNTQIFKIPSW